MYFDKKKGKYQAKEVSEKDGLSDSRLKSRINPTLISSVQATLTLNLLTTKAVRMAGVTKIDLAAFLNDKIGGN